jgi:hypothetical protein
MKSMGPKIVKDQSSRQPRNIIAFHRILSWQLTASVSIFEVVKILLPREFAIVVLVFLSALAHAAEKGSFDGAWSVTIVCHEHTDEGKTAESYTFHYAVQVRDGILHGERLSPGQPGWMTLDGTIHPDGSAELHAQGLTNRPINTLRHVQRGTPYS